MTKTLSGVPFFKMQGTGNDFVFIDNRPLGLAVDRMPDWAKKICRRSFGVGADGLVFLEPAPAGRSADYIWHFYNADGSRAEMCGNASRCAAMLAVELGFAGQDQVLGTDAGPVKAKVLGDSGQVKVQLTAPKDLRLGLELAVLGQTETVHFVNTGVPHAVILCDDVSQTDVARAGSAIRHHATFAPAGTNADFIQVLERKRLLLRTFERGVEAETQACGTGAAAAVVVTHALELTDSEVAVTTTGGEVLTIALEQDALFLQGPAVKVYTGRMEFSALGITL